MIRDAAFALKIRLVAAGEEADPRRWFRSPQSVADARRARYADRLTVLQRWRSLVGPDDREVGDAIHSLEAGAAFGTDLPEGTPPDWGYGARADSGRKRRRGP